MQEIFDEYGGAILSMIGAISIITVAAGFLSGGPLAQILNTALEFYL